MGLGKNYSFLALSCSGLLFIAACGTEFIEHGDMDPLDTGPQGIGLDGGDAENSDGGLSRYGNSADGHDPLGQEEGLIRVGDLDSQDEIVFA